MDTGVTEQGEAWQHGVHGASGRRQEPPRVLPPVPGGPR